MKEKDIIKHDFEMFREAVKIVKKENKARGPVDLKELRKQLHELNKKNRKP